MKKVVSVTITAALDDLKHWQLVAQQLSCARASAADDKESVQRFCWIMGQNHARITEAINGIAEKANAARVKCLDDNCGGEKRFNAYVSECQRTQIAFCERGRDGHPVYGAQGAVSIPAAKVPKYQKAIEAVNKAYKDVGVAHETFVEIQAAILAKEVSVSLMCVDFADIPDEVNGTYMKYVEVLILGKPRINVLHTIMAKTTRHNRAYRNGLLGKINAAMDEFAGKPAAEVSVAIYRALFEAVAPDVAVEVPPAENKPAI